MIIFLDFDGVLHSSPAGERGHFYHLARFENIIREFPSLMVVISSSWREAYPSDVIFGLFSDDLQERILGMTPNGDGKPPYSRYEEIISWISLNNYDGPWLAIDDAHAEFPEGFSHLLLCQTDSGFDEIMENKLRKLLAS